MQTYIMLSKVAQKQPTGFVKKKYFNELVPNRSGLQRDVGIHFMGVCHSKVYVEKLAC